jgi:hypothetical protein
MDKDGGGHETLLEGNEKPVQPGTSQWGRNGHSLGPFPARNQTKLGNPSWDREAEPKDPESVG